MRTPQQRKEWLIAHPVRGAIVLGLFWGALMGIGWVIITPHRNVTGILLLWLAFGLFAFGPAVVVAVRRQATRSN